MKKTLLISALALGLSSAAFAGGLSEPVAAAPMATAAPVVSSDFTPGIYVGLQGGYADSGWSAYKNFTDVTRDTGIAARVLVGYDFHKYFAVEAGYFRIFPKTKITASYDADGIGDKIDIRTQAFDLVGKIKAPIMDNFGLYAKAGPGYLMLSASGDAGNSNRFDLVYGLGAYYTIDNWSIDLSYTRYNSGKTKFLDDKWQPNVDFYALGVSYKFNLPV